MSGSIPRISIFCTFTIIVAILFAFPAHAPYAMATEQITYDVSKSWFKPILTVNNDPEICKPLLSGYMNYFKSTQAVNPLRADYDGKRQKTDSIAIIIKILHEVEWKDTQIDGINLKIAEMNLDGKYYALVRRYYTRGSGEEVSEDIFITKPLSEYHLTKDNYRKYFNANNYNVFAQGSEKNIYEVIYSDNPRSKEYESNIMAVLSNIYEVNGSFYLSFITNESQSDTYLIFKLRNEKNLFLTCSLQTAPTAAQINAQHDKLPTFRKLRDDLFAMMGDEGNCGTGRFLDYAAMRLDGALNTMLYRPWANIVLPQSYYPARPDRRPAVDEYLALWGYSGIWNYHKYKGYLSHLPKAEREINKFYTRNFRFGERKSGELANSSISYALIAGFDHGSDGDEAHDLHKRILEGMSADELKKERISKEANNNDADSLLTFAIGHPELLTILLEKGLDPNRQNAFGKTPLMYAAQFNTLKAAKILLEHGAFTESVTIESGDTCNYTIRIKNLSALHYAVRYSSKDFIKLLLDYGAPTYFADSEGNTPYDYLVKFGGSDNAIPKRSSYGDLNQHLTVKDRKELRSALLPLDNDKKTALSREENLRAEYLYRQGKLQDAYRSLRKAITLDPDNERPLSNLSLVALKMGRLGESAEASTRIIEKTKSVTEKANAYFNLGLACKKAGSTGHHFSDIEYDGRRYCSAEEHVYAKTRTDRSTISNFLMAYKLQPTQERLNAVLSLLQDPDPDNKKRLCKFSEDGSGLKSLYFGADLYFLIDSGKEVPFKTLINRYGYADKALPVAHKEVISLSDELRLERWAVFATSGSLMLDNTICSEAFSTAYGADTKLVELFSSKPGTAQSAPRAITLKQAMVEPSILILYGDNLAWTLEGNLSKTAGVYVHGSSTVRIPNDSVVPVFADKKSAYPNPKGSSFNSTTRTPIGLIIDAIIDVGRDDMTTLTDQIVSNNKYIPKTPQQPTRLAPAPAPAFMKEHKTQPSE